MYSNLSDFITDWKAEASFTLKIFEAIPDELILTTVSDNVRSLGRLAWHITQTLTEMPHKAGVVDEDNLDNLPIPESFAKISDIYALYSEALIKNLEQKWSGTDLTESIEIYGQQWEKRKLLSVLITHQIHHRAQMTIVMRLLELNVPGIYGPSKEEWGQFGMEAQD